MASFLRTAAIAASTFFGLRKLTNTGERRSPVPEVGKPLPVCSRYPNCVNSQATESQNAIEPLHFEGDAEQAQAHLRTILYQIDRCELMLDLPGQIWAKTRSKGLGFVDDMDFLIDDQQKRIHMRAEARMGRKDFDKNRERLEYIRSIWRKSGAGY